MLSRITMAVRFGRDFGTFLQRPLSPDECRQQLVRQLEGREAAFLDIVQRGIFDNARSPYRALMRHAGIAYGDVAEWARASGLDATLARLHDAGVSITLDEFKGRQPIRRGGLVLPVRARDFDNPLLMAHYETRTGGSRSVRGVGKRLIIDLNLLAHESAYDYVFLSAVDALTRPMGLWRPVPPAGAGMKILLRHARIGMRAERWFSQAVLSRAPRNLRYYAFTRYVVAWSALCRRRLPSPEYVPLEQAVVVARWLAEKAAAGTPAYLEANAGAAVRVCVAAQEHGLDITDTLFRIGGEPFTEARARIIAGAGARAFCHYNMGEAGRLGIACSMPKALDDVHVAMDKIALLQRDRRPVASGDSVGALYCSTLHPAAPKIMLNVEVGDHGVLSERSCGCPLGELGFTQHLQGIRSYEKLTSEGMQFTGSEVLRLVEEVLPGRFGGGPTDYQFVEEEEGGLSRISLVVSPRVGTVDESQVVDTVLQALGSPPRATGGHWLMAEYWRGANALRVVRREPYVTAAAKILPLHVIRRDEGSRARGG
ncbi:MAG TPA: hypothetical protein VMS64_39610 [Candidatus Methylomirabilis sp.]|nr:hypothetical protein [Candidatus Methylomirabilis sp.]